MPLTCLHPALARFARALLPAGSMLGVVLAVHALALHAADGRRKAFNIPAGQASVTLKQFTAQAGEQLLYTMDAVKGVASNAVKGEMSARQALDQMFAGTALRVVQDRGNGALSLVRVPDPNVPRAAPASSAGLRPKPPRRESETPRDETIELSPFAVHADRDAGYVATNSLAGSRLNTPLRDTAASISVITSDFLSDIGATSLADAMQWSTNSQLQMQDTLTLANTNDDTNATFFGFDAFRVRGLNATSTRNYFAWDLPVDSYNLERVEEARGPNSILFGIGSAGGVVNASTKRAHFGAHTRRAGASLSSHGGYRGTIDVNQSLGPTLAVRFNGVYDRTESFRNYSFGEKRFMHLAAGFKPHAATTLRVEYETGLMRQIVGSNQHATDQFSSWIAAGRPLITAPIPTAQNADLGVTRLGSTTQVTYIGNTRGLLDVANQYRSAGTDYALPPDVVPYAVSTGGPGALRRPHFDTSTVTLEQQFGADTFLELAYNHQQYLTRNYMPATDSWRLFIDPNATLPTGEPNPFAGRFMVEGETWAWDYGLRADTFRATLAHELEAGKAGRYRFAAMGERQWRSQRNQLLVEVWEGAPYHPLPENAANVVRRRNYVSPGDWASYHRTMPLETGLIRNLRDPVTGRTLSSTMIPRNAQNLRDNPENQRSLLLAVQARYLRDRLVLGLGYRFDELEVITRGARRDPATSILEQDYTSYSESSYTGRTRMAGAVYHVTPAFSIFYNNSNNFSLPPNIRIAPIGTRASNPEGRGIDYGIALTLFDGKLSARATRYHTDLINGANSNYGGTVTSPQQVGNFVLNALIEQGLISAAEAEPHRVDNTGATFSQVVEGYEASLTANPARNWRLQANFSYTDGYTSEVAPEIQAWVATTLPYLKRFDPTLVTNNAGRTIGQVIADFEDYHNEQLGFVGLALAGNRKFKLNIFTSYTFSEGRLNGVSIGGGYRHFSKMPIGRYADQRLQYGPSYWDSHAMIGYRFPRAPLAWLKRLRVQLNVQNLFNEDDAFVFRRTQDTPEIVRRIRVRDPRMWRLTTTFDF